MAYGAVTEQSASPAPAPSGFLTEQSAAITSVAWGAVTEQVMVSGGGSLAFGVLAGQSADWTRAATARIPAGAKASGSGYWTQYYAYTSDSTGQWL